MSSTRAASPGARLDGRTAVISGGSRGIGAACARALHEAGARVVLVGRDGAALDATATSLGGRVDCIRSDFADAQSVDAALRAIRALVADAPDIVVNNAGRFTHAPAHLLEPTEFAATIQVNLVAQFAIVRSFLADMRGRGRGHIVTIGSVADRTAFEGNAAYAASKYGARGLHEVLREELRGSGVRVSLVSPGPTDTSLWDEHDPDRTPGFTPRARMLSPADVADAVRYVVTCPESVNVDELRLSYT